MKIDAHEFFLVHVRTVKGDRWTGCFDLLGRIPGLLEIRAALVSDNLDRSKTLKAAGASEEEQQAADRGWWRLTDVIEYAAPKSRRGKVTVRDLTGKTLGSITIRRHRVFCPVPTPVLWDVETVLPTLPSSPPGSCGPCRSTCCHLAHCRRTSWTRRATRQHLSTSESVNRLFQESRYAGTYLRPSRWPWSLFAGLAACRLRLGLLR
jgi:hypothetical protein